MFHQFIQLSNQNTSFAFWWLLQMCRIPPGFSFRMWLRQGLCNSLITCFIFSMSPFTTLWQIAWRWWRWWGLWHRLRHREPKYYALCSVWGNRKDTLTRHHQNTDDKLFCRRGSCTHRYKRLVWFCRCGFQCHSSLFRYMIGPAFLPPQMDISKNL